MSRRLVELPLKSYLYKFVIVEENMVDGIYVPSRRFHNLNHTNYSHQKRYFEQAASQSYPKLKVWTHDHLPQKLYQYVTYFEQRFIDKFVDHVEVRMGIIAEMEAIREFLNKYDITEEDYKEKSIWRRWMREKEKRQLS